MEDSQIKEIIEERINEGYSILKSLNVTLNASLKTSHIFQIPDNDIFKFKRYEEGICLPPILGQKL